MKYVGGRAWRIALFTAATLLFAVTAISADVEALLRKGIDLRKQGREREALAVFEQCAQVERSPRVIAQIGLAEQALGLWSRAADHLKEALAAAADPWIKKNERALKDSFAVVQEHVGRLEMWGTPDGAEVLLDGEAVGTLPMVPMTVATGTLVVTVRAQGYLEISRTVEIRKGMFLREHVVLRSSRTSRPNP